MERRRAIRKTDVELRKENRNFKVIYFSQRADDGSLITKNVTIAFNQTDEKELYERIKDISSTELKKIISVFHYKQLTALAEKENRKITELIKLRLAERLLNMGQIRNKTIPVDKKKIRKWLNVLKKIKLYIKEKDYENITAFLKELII